MPLPSGAFGAFLANNRIASKIIRIQQDEINCEVSIMLPGGEILTSGITTESLEKMAFKVGMPILGVL